MSPRIVTSEPAFRAPVGQWQRDRAAGRILPMVDSQGRQMSFGRWWAELCCAAVVIGVPLALLVLA